MKYVRKRKINVVYYCIYIKSGKMVLMNLSAGQQWRHRHREQTDGHGGREGGTDGESSMETYTLAYAKQIASGYLLYDLRNSNQGSVTTRGMGWGGRREGGSSSETSGI